MGHAWDRGQWAEAKVRRYLRWRGWRILASNWHGGGGELDIVAVRWRTLLVVEVRYRSKGRPLASIDAFKMQVLRRSMLALVRRFEAGAYRLRLDCIAVSGDGRMQRACDVLAALGIWWR